MYFCISSVSDAPKEAPKAAKYSSKDILSAKSDEEKKTEVNFNQFSFAFLSYFYDADCMFIFELSQILTRNIL